MLPNPTETLATQATVLWFQRISLGPAKRLFVFTVTPMLTRFGTESIFFFLFSPNVAKYFSLAQVSFVGVQSYMVNTDDGVFLSCRFFICKSV